MASLLDLFVPGREFTGCVPVLRATMRGTDNSVGVELALRTVGVALALRTVLALAELFQRVCRSVSVEMGGCTRTNSMCVCTLGCSVPVNYKNEHAIEETWQVKLL